MPSSSYPSSSGTQRRALQRQFSPYFTLRIDDPLRPLRQPIDDAQPATRPTLLIRRQSERKRRGTGGFSDTDAEPPVVEPERNTHIVSGPAAVQDRVRDELARDEQRLEVPTPP